MIEVIVSIHTGILATSRELVHSSSPHHHNVIISNKDDGSVEGALPHDDGMMYLMYTSYVCNHEYHVCLCVCYTLGAVTDDDCCVSYTIVMVDVRSCTRPTRPLVHPSESTYCVDVLLSIMCSSYTYAM